MQCVPRTPKIQAISAVVLLALATSQPVTAQDVGDHAAPSDAVRSTPATKPSVSDEPPPLDLGKPANQSKPDGERWSGYARATRDALNAAISTNSKTRDARFNVRFEIWVDPKGHVTRLLLTEPSGDANLDAAFNAVVSNLTLPAPANDMPMPVKVRIVGPAT
jgi:TonB family protein